MTVMPTTSSFGIDLASGGLAYMHAMELMTMSAQHGVGMRCAPTICQPMPCMHALSVLTDEHHVRRHATPRHPWQGKFRTSSSAVPLSLCAQQHTHAQAPARVWRSGLLSSSAAKQACMRAPAERT